MSRKAKKEVRRSDCPLSVGLEIFGDKWTLLILRDLFFKNLKTFKEFVDSGEGIATNVLSDRLQRLMQEGIITSEQSKEDGRILIYRPTEKGLTLLPVVVEIILWVVQYEKTAAPEKMICTMRDNKKQFIEQVRKKLADHDFISREME